MEQSSADSRVASSFRNNGPNQPSEPTSGFTCPRRSLSSYRRWYEEMGKPILSYHHINSLSLVPGRKIWVDYALHTEKTTLMLHSSYSLFVTLLLTVSLTGPVLYDTENRSSFNYGVRPNTFFGSVAAITL